MYIKASAILISSLIVLFFNFLVYLKNRKSSVNQAFATFGVFIFIWLFSFSLAYFSENLESKLFWFRAGYVGIIFIPVSFYAFIFHLLDRKKDAPIVYLNYFVGTLFLCVHLFYRSLVVDLYDYSWGYYPNTSTLFHYFFLTFFLTLFSVSNAIMGITIFVKRNVYPDIHLMRIKYAFLGSIVGSLASLDFLGSYGINFPGIGFVFMLLYPLIFAYAILKYRFMEVSIAVTRSGIFVGVYSLVLGVPFACAFSFRDLFQEMLGQHWWVIPLLMSTLLGTIGPYIYIFIQRKAEDRLLQEQRQYQATLRQASLGMGQIKDLKRLLNLIVHVVTRAVKIENCKIFLRHEDSKQYILKAVKGTKPEDEGTNKLPFDSPLVHYFNQMKEPLVYEEVKQRRFDIGGEGLKELEDILHDIDSALVVPSFIEQKLIAIISLGKKRSGKLYTYDDLAVFAILANQSALAIENAQFYEDMKRTHVQLMKAEKMATVGTMADGLSHQINNRLHAMGFIAGDLLDTVRLGLKNGTSQKNKALLQEIEGGLERIQQNVKHGGEIVGGLLRYTRKGEQGYTAVDFQEMLKSAFEMAQFKVKINMLDVHKHFDDDLPKIKGNFTQLQEVFFNLIDNSYDAMMQRHEELKEEGFRPRLDIFARESGPTIEIIMQDNGMGVKESDMHKLFTPFFTTKATSKKGTGLGLYVIRQIIEDNHGGKVNFSSKYKIGSETQIILPVAVGKKG